MEATADTAASQLLLVDLTPPNAPHPQQAVIAVSPERARYNVIRMEYERRAARAEEAFSKAYDENIHDLDTLIEDVNELAADILVQELTQTVADLVAMGAYSLSEATFLQEYGDGDMGWGQAFSRIADQYAEIVMNAEQLDAYRVNRREGRGRVMAMGDSVGGLAKGYVMASGVNLAVGALHRTFNGLGKIISAIGDSMKKSRIFDDPETKGALCADMYRAVFILHYAFIDAANGALGANITGLDEDNEVQEGLGLLSNIQKGRLPADKVPELLGRCLTLAPYNKEIYDFILLQYGDPTGSLEKAAAYFGIDMGAAKARLIEKEGEALLGSGESWEARAQKLMTLRKLTGTDDHPRLLHYRRALAEGAMEAWLEEVKLAHDKRAAKLKGLCDLLGFADGHALRQELLDRTAAVEEAALLEQASRISQDSALSPEQRREQLGAVAKGMGLHMSPVYQKAEAYLKVREEAIALCAIDKPLVERALQLRQIALQLGLPADSEALRNAVLMMESEDLKARTVEGKIYETKEAARSQAKVNKFIHSAAGIIIAIFAVAAFVAVKLSPSEPASENSQVSEVAAPAPEEVAAPAPEAVPTQSEAGVDPVVAQGTPVVTESGVRDGTQLMEIREARLEDRDGQRVLAMHVWNVGQLEIASGGVFVRFFDGAGNQLGDQLFAGPNFLDEHLRVGGDVELAKAIDYPSAARFEFLEVSAYRAGGF